MGAGVTAAAEVATINAKPAPTIKGNVRRTAL
jgi:hypothetical protein